MRSFCKRCTIRVVPCAHLYVDGALFETLPLGPSAWAAFAERLEQIAGVPDGVVLSAELPPDRDALRVSGINPW